MVGCCYVVFLAIFYSFTILKKISLKEIIYICLVSFPNTIGFILTLFFFTLELKKYFIIRLISQIIIFFFFLGVYDLSREGHRDGIGNIIPSMSCMFIALSAIIFESLNLTNFVVGYAKMSKFYKVEYYFHFLIFPLCIRHIKKYRK